MTDCIIPGSLYRNIYKVSEIVRVSFSLPSHSESQDGEWGYVYGQVVRLVLVVTKGPVSLIRRRPTRGRFSSTGVLSLQYVP